MAVTAATIFDRYYNGMSNAGQRIKDGVNSTKKSQTGNAIKAKDKMIANWQAAMSKGRWEAGLQAAGDQAWKDGLINVGIAKIPTSINNRKAKILKSFETVAAAAEAVKSAVDGMPKVTLEDSLQRVRVSMETQRKVHGKA